MKRILLPLVLLLLAGVTYSQAWMQYLPQSTSEKERTFFDYQDAFQEWCQATGIDKEGYYYHNNERIKAKGWKQFKRWEILMEGQYDPLTGRMLTEEVGREIARFYNEKQYNTDNLSGNWTSIAYGQEGWGNDGNGRVNCVAFHPSDQNTFWVGTPWGGIWRTTDYGQTWTPLSDFIMEISVGSIAIPSDYTTSQTIYLGTGDRGYNKDFGIGVLKSTDGGATWQNTGLTRAQPEYFFINRLLILPSDNSVIFAGTNEGIYRSTNAGVSWDPVLVNYNVVDMEFHPGNESIMYASTRSVVGDPYTRVMKSTIGGTNWQTTLEVNGCRTDIAVSPDEPDWIYAVAANHNDGLFGFFRSVDTASNFTMVYDGSIPGNNLLAGCVTTYWGGQGNYDLAIVIHPQDAENVFIGGVEMWVTTNGGVSWTLNTDGYGSCNFINHNVHVDHHWLAYQPGTNNLFTCSDGGIYYSTNNGTSYTNISGGLVINQPYRVGCSPQVYSEVLMGQQDNGIVLWSDYTIDFVGGGDGGTSVINPSDVNNQYFSNNNPYRLEATQDHWSSRYFIDPPNDESGNWFKPIVCLPPDTILFGFKDLWRSDNKGVNIYKLLDVPDDIPLKIIAVAPSNNDIIIIANNSNVYKTTDGGANWQTATGSWPVIPETCYQVTFKDDDPDVLWLTDSKWDDGKSVFKSTDGGYSWVNISAGLPDCSFYDILQNKLQTGYEELYVCGYLGVFLKLGDNPWIPFSEGLPHLISFDMDIHYNGAQSKIRVATHGRGVWESDLFSIDNSQPWIWNGIVSHNWHDPRNWNYMEVPNGSADVIIPAGKPHSPTIDYFPATCGSLTIKTGAQLYLSGEVLTVVDSLVISGALNLTAPGSEIEVDGHITWKAGSSFNANTSVNNKIRIYGNWTFGHNANSLVIDSADVYFMGNTFSNIYVMASGCGFRNVNILKNLTKHTIIDAQSTANMYIRGNLNIVTGASMTHNSTHDLYLFGDLNAEGNLYFQSGTLVLNGGNSTIQTTTPVSFINHLILAADANAYKTLASDIDVKGNLMLHSGHLDQAGFSITLNGDLGRTVGMLDNSASRIIFGGSNKQTIMDGFAFDIMELAKAGDTLFINSPIHVTCQTYDWTEGTLAVTQTGTFTAQDLADDGIYGSYYLNSTQSINLTQDAGQSVNLNGKIHIEGGSFIVNGGSGTSQWPGGVNAELWMSDGLLDFKDQGIHLSNSAALLEVITGGTIRTTRSFTGERNDFTPAGGMIELRGPDDVELSHGIGGAFWDVRIFKSGTASVAQNLTVDNSITIAIGTLDINGKTVHVENQLNIIDDLKMTLPSSQLTVEGDVFWRYGSSADVSEGTISFKGDWYFHSGTDAQLTGNNTVKATGTTSNQYIYHQDDDACFANFSQEKPFVTIQKHLVLENDSDYPMRVNGDLTLLSNNSLRIDSAQMIIGGTLQTNSTSFVRVYETGSLTAGSASIGGILNLFGGDFTAGSAAINYGLVMEDDAIVELDDLTLDGTIDLNDGALTVHNNFTQGAGGHLILDGGSFILDKPYTGNLFGFAGTTDLNGGFFEISYDGIQFGTGATVNFNGGTLRVGGHFRAINPNSFQPTSGTVELINTIGTNIEVTNGNYFHRLVINKSGSNPCYAVYPLTVDDQFVLQRGEYGTLGHGLYIGDDLVIESLGKLTAGSAEIHVGGDWVNNRGTAGFAEGTSSVWLTPSQASTVCSETFHELVVHASTDPDVYVTMLPNATITINGDLTLSEGAMLMNDNCTLHVDGMIFIKNNGGLNANPAATGTVINCLGHWWDYNTVAGAQRSFTPGNSTVNFAGAVDQQLIAYPGAVFFHLNIQKSGGSLLPSNNLTVLGDIALQGGNWSYGATGLSHTFKGNFSCLSPSQWLDDQNTVSFEGEQQQTITNTTGSPLSFGILQVDQPDGRNRSGALIIASDISCATADFVSGTVSVTSHDFDCSGDMNILADASVEFLDNSTVRMADNKLINVNGGSLYIGGDAVDHPLVTHLNSGYYKIQVHNGGSINAEHTVFEFLGTRGIEIAADGVVSGEYPFNHCTLRDGISGGTLLYMSSASDITLHNLHFPASTLGGTFNVAKYEDAGNVYLPGAIGDFAGPSFEHDPNGRVHWPSMGIWEGDESTEWHDVHNWRYDFQVPDVNTDVIIPAGAAYYPNFHQVETTVRSLKIDANASLTISKDSLTVLTFSDIRGQLNLTADYTSLFTDSLVWQAGSSANVVNRGTLYVTGNMFIRKGSNLDMTTGTVQFQGNQDSELICHDTARIFHLYNYKPSPHSLHLAGDTLAQLTISGNFRNGAGATLRCPSTQEWVFGAQVRNTDGGHFRCQEGTFRLTGGTPSTYFRPNQGDYFNNFIIETTSPLNLYNAYSDTLRINGDLVFNQGSTGTSALQANNFKIMLMGDWVNNLGSGAFIPGTGTVCLLNPSPQSVTGNSTFYNMEAGGSFSLDMISFYGNNTIENRLYIVVPVEVYGTLNASVLYNDDGGSELHLRSGSYTQAGTLVQGGLVHGDGGTMMVSDLDEDYVTGIYNLENGLVALNQAEYDSPHDLRGNIIMSGGELRFTGGTGSSAWPSNLSGSYASITMTGGLLNLQNHYVDILNNNFTENISGGTIRVGYGFVSTLGVTTFNPTGGAVEVVSENDAGVSILEPESYFWKLVINHSDAGGTTYPGSNFTIKNELRVISGKFEVSGVEVTVGP